jgi:phage-related protein
LCFPAKVAVKIDDATDLLNGLPVDAPPLAFPHSSQIEGPLRELRCHYGKRLFRILYQRSGNLFILLHAIEKSGAKVPGADVQLAQERMRDFQARMDARSRVRPRDAPDERRARASRGPLT